MNSSNAKQPPIAKKVVKKQGAKLGWPHALICSAVLGLGFFLGSHYLHASGSSQPTLTIESKAKTYNGNDLQGDALEVAAVESVEALRSVLLGVTYAGERMITVGIRGHILYSDDHGVSWHQSDVPVRTTLTSVFFISATKGWAVGHDTVILTTNDGGLTWIKQLDGHNANTIMLTSAQQRATNLEVETTTASNNSVNQDLSTYQDRIDFAEIALDEAKRDDGLGPNKALMDVWFNDENNGLVIGASGYILRTNDGGVTWQDATESLSSIDFYHLYKLVANGNGRLFLLGEAGQVFRSTDLGQNWQRLSVPYQGSFFGGLAKQSDNSVYIFGMSGVVLKSTDNGDSWDKINTSTRAILQNATVISNDRVAIVGLGGSLLIEDLKNDTFVLNQLGTRAAFTGVLAGNNNQFITVGETGVQLYNEATTQGDGNTQGTSKMESVDTVRFMFSRRKACLDDMDVREQKCLVDTINK